MSRHARIVCPGFLYHITQRGNYQQNVFRDGNDRVRYLNFLQKSAVKYGLDVFAYCLMINHVHFIVVPNKTYSLARTFGIAHKRYAQYFNEKRNVKGHLWQGRFYSCILHGTHMREAVRYVERNPVRANLVTNAWDYPWSSARAHVKGNKNTFGAVKLSDVKEYIGVHPWKEFLQEKEPQDELKKIRENTKKGLILGPAEFTQEVEKKLNRQILPNSRGRPWPENK